jgi:AAA15 family ATPase/GTPase
VKGRKELLLPSKYPNMRINAFEFTDKANYWRIEPIMFNHLTLLVGASGAGKSRILKSLSDIKNIAKGKSLNGVSWAIDFSIQQNNYRWEGQFEWNETAFFALMVDDDSEKTGAELAKPIILYEQLVINGVRIVERQQNTLIFRGIQTAIPLKAEQSVVFLIPDPDLVTIEKGFRRLLWSDYTHAAQGFVTNNIQLIDELFLIKYNSLEQLRNSEEPLTNKFYWVSKRDKKLWTRIKSDLRHIFPSVEDVKMEPLSQLKDLNLPLFVKALPFIQIKEKDVKHWIPIMNISSGMYRTLIHILELHLCAAGTVILIDEFENSLGVNCIDELTTELKGATHRIQFILTSHHPYIINSINTSNWKIVTRQGSTIFTQDAAFFQFDKSKHAAFVQLINTPEYKTGLKQL